jgi:Icc-related predicted phosphoesterase
LGSQAVGEAIINKQPTLVVCGHIHGSAGQVAYLDKITIINAGPEGMIWKL